MANKKNECPKCGAPLVQYKKDNGKKVIACSKYPNECDYIEEKKKKKLLLIVIPIASAAAIVGITLGCYYGLKPSPNPGPDPDPKPDPETCAKLIVKTTEANEIVDFSATSSSTILVKWGDNTSDNLLTHTYAKPGTYIVYINSDNLSELYQGEASDAIKYIEVFERSDMNQFSDYGAWESCTGLEHVKIPTTFKDMCSFTFSACSNFKVLDLTSFTDPNQELLPEEGNHTFDQSDVKIYVANETMLEAFKTKWFGYGQDPDMWSTDPVPNPPKL